MTQGKAFIKQLMEAFLTGFAIATGVNLLIFPRSSRQVVFDDLGGYLKALEGVIGAQKGYLRSLEQYDEVEPCKDQNLRNETKTVIAGQKLKTSVAGLTALHAKIRGDLVFAKREVALYGKLDSKELDEVFALLRGILLPVLGMGTLVEILEMLGERQTSNDFRTGETVNESRKATRLKARKHWNTTVRALHESFEELAGAMVDGLNHFALAFHRKKRAKADDNDCEARVGVVSPGDPRFQQDLARKVTKFYDERKVTLGTWCEEKGLSFPEKVDSSVSAAAILDHDIYNDAHFKNKQQLYLVLYMEFLMWSIGSAVLDLVRFADSKTEAGVMEKGRLILPGKRRLEKWLISTFEDTDSSAEHAPDQREAGLSNIHLGDSYGRRKDPEHLPPASKFRYGFAFHLPRAELRATDSWQRFGNGIRKVSHRLASPECAFGFRVACATMSIGILAYLETTQTFFVRQRLVWAMIMVAIGMTMTSGSGIFGLIGRVVNSHHNS